MQVNKGPLPFIPKPSESRYPFAKMEVDDWIVVDTIEEAERTQNAAHSYGVRTRTGFKLSRRAYEGRYYLIRVK